MKAGIATTCAVLALMVLPSIAHAAIGDNFSFAPVTDSDTNSTAPAFPGTSAFWAGVCDLHTGLPEVGAPPADRRYPGCIEQPASSSTGGFGGALDQPQPPFAPGVVAGSGSSIFPDGWLTSGLTGPGPAWRLKDVVRAGTRPDGSASFWFSRSADASTGAGLGSGPGPDGQPRNIFVSIPPGVIGNPNAVPKCPAEDLKTSPVTCHPKTQIGVSTIAIGTVTAAYPVYNVEPRDGKTAELMISGAGLDQVYDANAPVVARARTDGDFGIDAGVSWIPSAAGILGQTFTIWGVPWARSHDKYRPIAAYCGTQPVVGSNAHAGGTSSMQVTGLTGGTANGCSQNGVSYDPSWGPIRPFLTTQTECSPVNAVTKIFADNWHTAVTDDADSVVPLLEGCGDIQFDTSFLLNTTSTAPDSASGVEVDLTVPQNEAPPSAKRFNPCDAVAPVGPGCTADDVAGSAPTHWRSTAGLARSHLKDSVVTLPAGFSVNPSAGTGLAGCSDAQIGVTNASSNPLVFNNGDPFNKDGGADGAECPDGSILGTAEVTTHLLDEKLTGEVVLGTPKATAPQSGEMLRLFIVVRNRERGLVAKIHGSTSVEGVVGEGGSGKLVTTFKNNPRVPFSNLKLSFKGGSKGILGTPQECGDYSWTSTFSAWSGAPDVPQGGQFPVSGDCSPGFAPTLVSGMNTRQARAHGTFAFKFARNDGERWFDRLTAKLPTGLLASLKGLIGPNLCSNAQIDEYNRLQDVAFDPNRQLCPDASRIGTVDAKAGAGDPFVLERKGDIYLTEGYKGGEYGLAVRVRPIAGPFRGDMELKTIVVRQAVHIVERRTGRVTAVSDAFPRVWHGIPLRVREVTVNVDRPEFMLNPSNCEPKQVEADLFAIGGGTSSPVKHFQTTGCAALPFKPKLALRLTGRKQIRTGQHPGIRAQVTQTGIGEAGIGRAEVRLPKSLALDVRNARALCEFADGTKPDLENHCPAGSIVGRARAESPLLNKPLVGNVYFVKNIRRDPKTGNEIRTLPMVIAALRGEVPINLWGESDTRRGKLVSMFNVIPDAPVSKFNMNINGGKNGIIAVTRTRRSLLNICRLGRQVAESDMDGANGRRYDEDIVMSKPCAKRSQTSAKKRAAAKRKQAAAKAKRR